MDKQHDLEQLFQAAKSQQAEYSFDEAQQSFLAKISELSSEVSTKKKSFFSFKNWIIMLTIASAITLSLFIGSLHEKEEKKPHFVSSKEAIYSIKNKQQTANQPLAFQRDTGNTTINQVPFGYTSTDSSLQIDAHVKADENKPTNEVRTNGKNKIRLVDDGYIFPKLTEDEIRATNKQKKAMLRALEKMDKKEFVRMPSGSFDFEGKLTSLQSFLIQRTEVTNLEYRTFLFDLLIQDRKEEFLKAKPDQSQWSKINGLTALAVDPMEENYFSHPAYNNYPVVNISREGAEMYCKWLSQELWKVMGQEDAMKYNDVRLPGRVEWVYAASAMGEDYPYPWKGQFLRNSDGVFMANYKPFENSYMDDGGFFSLKVDSYSPNSVGLYNMSGNVSEMVYNAANSREDPGTAGGGWMSNAEEIKILGPDPYHGKTDPHPNIGFRVVMTIKNK